MSKNDHEPTQPSTNPAQPYPETGLDPHEIIEAHADEAGVRIQDSLQTAAESTKEAWHNDVRDLKNFTEEKIDDAKAIAHAVAHPSEIKEYAEDRAKAAGQEARHLAHEVAHPSMIVQNVHQAIADSQTEIDKSIDRLEKIAEDHVDSQKSPTALKVFGVLCIIGGLIAIPSIVETVMQTIHLLHAGSLVGEGIAAIVFTFVQLAVYISLAVTFVFFGIRILRNKRRHAAITIDAIFIQILVGILCSITLHGMSYFLIMYGIVFVLAVVLQAYVDPFLSHERRIRRKLRDVELEQETKDGTLGMDTTGRGYITLNFFNLFWIFVVCSILGLIIETVFHFIVFGAYQDRAGLLFGPFSPIYGCGAVLMTVFLNRFHKSNIIIIFFISAIIGGAFEYFTSWFMQYAFGAVAWNYTGMWLSIGGRTCGLFMAMWGVLGVIWIKLLLPILLHLVNLIPWNWRYAITAIAAALMLVDAVMTLQALDCWYMRLSGESAQAIAANPVQEFYDEHFDNTFMADRFQSMTIHPDDAIRAHGGGSS